MNEEEIRERSLALVERSQIAFLGTLGEDGFPHVKALMKAEAEGIGVIWFSTNTSNRHVAQLGRNPKASVYFVHHPQEPWHGLMLTGTVELRQDRESRERLWEDGRERYYPLGVTDPDYTVMRFVAERGHFWQFGTRLEFEI